MRKIHICLSLVVKSNYIWQVLKKFLINKEKCENYSIITPIGRYEENDNADFKRARVFFAIILTFVLMMNSVLNSLDSKNPQLEATLLRLRTSFSLLIYPELYDGKGANCSRKFSRGCLLLLPSSSCSQKYIIPLLTQIWGWIQKTAFSILPAVYLKIFSFSWKNYIISPPHLVQLCHLHSLQLFVIHSIMVAVRHRLENVVYHMS